MAQRSAGPRAATALLLLSILLAGCAQRAAALSPPPNMAQAVAGAAAPGAAVPEAAPSSAAGGPAAGLSEAARRRIEARRRGVTDIDASLVAAAQRRAAAAAGGVAAKAEPIWQGSGGRAIRPTGTVKVLVIPVDFSDSPWNVTPNNPRNTPALLQERMFGNGNPQNYPFESLTNFYRRSSFGKLNVTGTVTPYYRAKQTRSYYSDGYASRDTNAELIDEALAWLNGQGWDLSQFDGDGDGYIGRGIDTLASSTPRCP